MGRGSVYRRGRRLRRAGHRLRQPAGRGRPGPPGHGEVLGGVVPFGDPRLADPFALSCQGAVPAGAGRWASDRVWVYDFREALPPGTPVQGVASPRVEAGRRRQRPGRGGAARRAEGVRLFDRRPGDRLDAAGRRRRDRGRPALPDPSQRAGGRGERAGQRPLRGRRHRRAAAAGASRRRAARAAAEGAPHRAGAVAAAPDRPLRAAARQRRGASPGLGQGHRRRRQSAGGDDDRAELPAARCAPRSPRSSAASARRRPRPACRSGR